MRRVNCSTIESRKTPKKLTDRDLSIVGGIASRCIAKSGRTRRRALPGPRSASQPQERASACVAANCAWNPGVDAALEVSGRELHRADSSNDPIRLNRHHRHAVGDKAHHRILDRRLHLATQLQHQTLANSSPFQASSAPAFPPATANASWSTSPWRSLSHSQPLAHATAASAHNTTVAKAARRRRLKGADPQ